MKLTDEQKSIVESRDNIKVHAVAGSGKTSTLIHYSASRKSKNILYLAFNRSVKTEAIRRFAAEGLKNVKVDTAHSLAWRSVIAGTEKKVRFAYKSSEIASMLNLSSAGKITLSGLTLAYHIARFSEYFCNSAVSKVHELDYLSIIQDPTAIEFAKKHLDHIIKGTRTLLAKMNSGDIALTHDFYLKKFQLLEPKLDYDCILFDEGQDASPVMLDIFSKQDRAVKVIVGDMHQQIYSWRFAINALSSVDFKEYSLTTSFRFPQYIANCAMECLGWKEKLLEYNPVTINGAGKRSKVHSHATLARSNIALIKSAIDFIANRRASEPIYFEGNFATYTMSENGSLYDVLNLYNNKTALIKNPEISAMKSFDTLSEYAETTGDTELMMLIQLVEEYGDHLPYYLKKIRDCHVDDDNRKSASMIFSTVHKCKGLEYDSVTLADDFIDEDNVDKLASRKNTTYSEIESANEEINLRYVAITRAKSKITFADGSTLPVKKYENVKRTKIKNINNSRNHNSNRYFNDYEQVSRVTKQRKNYK